MGQEPTPIEKALQRYQNYVVGMLAFVVVFALTIMVVLFWQTYRLGEQASDLRHVATTTHNSLCALQQNMRRSYDDTAKFLKANPAGLISGGTVIISAEILEQQQANRLTSLNALLAGGLTCEEVDIP